MKVIIYILKSFFSLNSDLSINDRDLKNYKIKRNTSLDKYENDPTILKKAEEAGKNLSRSILPKELQKLHTSH